MRPELGIVSDPDILAEYVLLTLPEGSEVVVMVSLLGCGVAVGLTTAVGVGVEVEIDVGIGVIGFGVGVLGRVAVGVDDEVGVGFRQLELSAQNLLEIRMSSSMVAQRSREAVYEVELP